jgi:hypothetical protein
MGSQRKCGGAHEAAFLAFAILVSDEGMVSLIPSILTTGRSMRFASHFSGMQLSCPSLSHLVCQTCARASECFARFILRLDQTA